MLEQSGYEVLSGKHRIPVYITLDDGEPLESRLYIDYFAKRDGDTYIVKVDKERQPLEWTGSAIRDRLLPYHLLYRKADGILYVSVKERAIRKISFDVKR